MIPILENRVFSLFFYYSKINCLEEKENKKRKKTFVIEQIVGEKNKRDIRQGTVPSSPDEGSSESRTMT